MVATVVLGEDEEEEEEVGATAAAVGSDVGTAGAEGGGVFFSHRRGSC